MPATLAGITTDAAITAAEENLWSMWAVFGRGERCRLVDEPGLMRFETPVPYIPYNSIMRFRVDERIDETIDETLDPYWQRDVPLMWVVHPTTRPADLVGRLAARGLVEAEVAPGMVARLDAIPAPDLAPPGIEIAQVTPADKNPFIELVTWRYSLPPHVAPTLRSIMETARFAEPGAPTQAWVARRNREVISKVVLHVGAGVAGIYGVATKAEARGLGLARLLTIRALEAAREIGIEIGILHSTPMARSLYEGLGFQRVADFRLYSTPGTLHL
ncbi:MAG: GNAT family N-acetyltransferase [Acidimicrobiia bacterium]